MPIIKNEDGTKTLNCETVEELLIALGLIKPKEKQEEQEKSKRD